MANTLFDKIWDAHQVTQLPGEVSLLQVDRHLVHELTGAAAIAELEDLQAAAAVVKGRRIATSVSGWVVPGSIAVKLAAEREGLDQIFLDAGFEWREPGCLMCVGANGDLVPSGQRCVSTSNSNRNFSDGRGRAR
ncbi:MAG: homoaconitase/3-isopropylmalate dehydratase large subunit [Burkholderiaceae bacterium]|jgi:homoaconitase/3-isopropylmalate dehydratase large subunit